MTKLKDASNETLDQLIKYADAMYDQIVSVKGNATAYHEIGQGVAYAMDITEYNSQIIDDRCMVKNFDAIDEMEEYISMDDAWM